jgi:hypothetical protein
MSMQQRSSRFARLAVAVTLTAALAAACAEGGTGGAPPDAPPVVVDARVDGQGATTACVDDNTRCAAAECCHYGTCVTGAREGERACTPAAAGECTTVAECDDAECCLVGVCLPGTAPTPSSCVPKRD